MYNGKAAALKKVRQKLLARALKLLAVEAALHYRSPMADPNFVETYSRSATTDSTFARNSSLPRRLGLWRDRKSTRLNSSHANISYAVFCLKKKKNSQCIFSSRGT